MSESSGDVANALTTGEIARRVDQPIHKIEYYIRSRGVKPIARAGTLRIFSEADFERIAAELRRGEDGGRRS